MKQPLAPEKIPAATKALEQLVRHVKAEELGPARFGLLTCEIEGTTLKLTGVGGGLFPSYFQHVTDIENWDTFTEIMQAVHTGDNEPFENYQIDIQFDINPDTWFPQ